ncbi:hypothetical protein GLYMA_09G052351v4 [Glycine max]|nr:hypothetical protein GLYMA_09G052351v4 [Glycine max]KAH1041580.1 hypothetical protein GYH30_024102 [Glycine max]
MFDMFLINISLNIASIYGLILHGQLATNDINQTNLYIMCCFTMINICCANLK